MGYYMRGDYYRGDPFLGGLIGGIAKSVGLGKVVSKAGRWLAGRITGSSVKKAAGVLAGTAATLPILQALPQDINIPGTSMTFNPGNAFPGGAPLFGRQGKYRRRMNPLNPKALKRALRRAQGFERFAKQTVNALYRNVDGRRVKTFKTAKKRRS